MLQPSPTSLRVDLTNYCNARCRFCCALQPKGFRGHPLEKYQPFFDQFTPPVTTGIRLSGAGEPTTHPDFGRIVKYLGERGFRLSLVTNGIRLFKLADSFRYFRGLVSISIHGLEFTHNYLVGGRVFKRVIAGIRAVRQANPDLSILVNCVVCPENVGELLEMARFFRGEQIRLHTQPLVHSDKPSGNGDRDRMREMIKVLYRDHPEVQMLPLSFTRPSLEEVIRYYIDGDDSHAATELDARKVACRCIYTEAIISPKGNLSVCARKIVLGNIFKAPLRKLWGNPPHLEVLGEVERHIQETGSYPEYCARCCYLERASP